MRIEAAKKRRRIECGGVFTSAVWIYQFAALTRDVCADFHRHWNRHLASFCAVPASVGSSQADVVPVEVDVQAERCAAVLRNVVVVVVAPHEVVLRVVAASRWEVLHVVEVAVRREAALLVAAAVERHAAARHGAEWVVRNAAPRCVEELRAGPQAMVCEAPVPCVVWAQVSCELPESCDVLVDGFRASPVTNRCFSTVQRCRVALRAGRSAAAQESPE